MTEKTIYYPSAYDPVYSTKYDITKKESEEVLRIYNLLVSPILREAKKPIINLQWLFNWEYENDMI